MRAALNVTLHIEIIYYKYYSYGYKLRVEFMHSASSDVSAMHKFLLKQMGVRYAVRNVKCINELNT